MQGGSGKKPLAARVVASLLALGVVSPSLAADHILISEFAVRPTDGEFIEIFNPTDAIVDLSEYYLTDYVLAAGIDPNNNYWHVVRDSLIPDPAFPNDFLAHFPEGTTIVPGQTYVISLKDDAAFTATWSTAGNPLIPDFELIDDGEADGVPALVDPGVPDPTDPSRRLRLVASAAGLSNDREVIVLFKWDGRNDLVQDVDIVQWGNAGPDFATLSPNKTGVIIDSEYDDDDIPSTYQPDTEPQGQDLASTAPGAHDFGRTVSRSDFQEGTETSTGGNGLFGHDETSENHSDTWTPSTVQSIGSPGPFGPPTLVRAAARSTVTVELFFSRALDRGTAEAVSHYSIVQIETAGGGLSSSALRVHEAELDADGTIVTLTTDEQRDRALYEVRVSPDILSEDLSEQLVGERRAFFRGANTSPTVRLEVPHGPFVPHLDGRMEITYVAPQGEEVRLRVYDTQGREVFVMAHEEVPPGGVRTISWDGRDDLRKKLTPGLYMLHLEVSGSGAHTIAPLVVATASEGTLR